jgi:hypothetical protein
MVENGEWASAEWDEAREEYTNALAELAAAIERAPAADRADRNALADVTLWAAAAKAAAEALHDQVRPDESNHIAEGLIDPDDVSETAERLDVGGSWQGWDCTEGWDAYRNGNDLYLNWWRNAYGNRHTRDLWALVRADFFAEAEAA